MIFCVPTLSVFRTSGKAIPQSASLTAPFTQGRLWCGAKSQLAPYTERCINVRFFSVQLPKKSLTSMSKIYLTLLQIKHVNKI